MSARNRKMDKLTAGQAAAILKVASRTVSKWADTGKIKHWKVNNDRRFHIDDLVAFAKENGMSHLLEKNLDAISDSSTSKDINIEVLNSKLKKAEAACKIAIDCLCESRFSLSENCFKIDSDKKKSIVQALEMVVKNG